MQHQTLNDFACQLRVVHGPRAGAEAAQHRAICEKSGDTKTAGLWHELTTILESSTLDCRQG
ncbi:hypothetical protein BH10PSE7_BH10PSE7_34840 [soil metagenome]